MRFCLHLRNLGATIALGGAIYTAGPLLAQEAAVADTETSASDQEPAPTVTEAPQPAAPAAEPEVWSASTCYCACADKKKTEDLAAAMRGAYKGLFFANDFRYLDDRLYDGPYYLGDQFKGIADGKIDIGGEYRSRYHHENNHRGLGLTGVDDEFWLSRVRLFANYRINDYVRFYGEYLYADSGGETFNPRPIEENRGDAQNLFFDVKLLEGESGQLSARLGRQELLLGAQRLVSPLDWANTRRTFDGYRLTYKSSDWDVDGFYTNPVARVAATAGSNQWDSANTNQHFYGTYMTRKGLDVGQLDTYYLGFDDETLNFSYHTIGGRVAGKGDEFLYELEGGVQFGQNSNNSEHGAGFMTAGIGRQLNLCVVGGKEWKPTIWGWYDWASGGNGNFVATGDNGFHHLFPLAHKYNGLMDLFGRRNLNDVNFQFITPIGKKVNFLLWYHYFFLDQATTPYNVTMAPFNAANAAGDRELGHEIDLLFTVNVNPRHNVLLGYSFFNAGDYYDTTAGVPTNADADFLYMQYQTRF